MAVLKSSIRSRTIADTFFLRMLSCMVDDDSYSTIMVHRSSTSLSKLSVLVVGVVVVDDNDVVQSNPTILASVVLPSSIPKSYMSFDLNSLVMDVESSLVRLLYLIRYAVALTLSYVTVDTAIQIGYKNDTGRVDDVHDTQ